MKLSIKHSISAIGIVAGLISVSVPAVAQDTFVMGIPGSPKTFQPWQLGQFQTPLHPHLYDRLISLDHDRQPVSQVATDWSFNEDGTVFTMELRDDVMFHSGRRLVAGDVVRSWEQITKGEFVGSRANLKPLAKLVNEVRAPDDTTVELVYEKPNPAVFDLLDVMYVVDMDQWGQHDTMSIGSGPYKLTEFKSGESLTMEVNKNYWGDIPEIEILEFRVIPDGQALVLGLQAGSVDGIAQFPVTSAQRLESQGYKVFPTSADGIFYGVLYNTQKDGPLANPDVRKAINLTINRARFGKIALSGVGRVACLPYPTASIAYFEDQDQACAFNPEQAKDLLVGAGYGDGFEIEILTSTQAASEYTKLAEILQNDLRQVGITASIIDLENSAFLNRIKKQRDFDIAPIAYGRAAKDPATMFGVASMWRADINPPGYDNPDYGRLINEGATTLDKDRRREIYREINQLILDDVFISNVHTTPRPFAHSSDWEGITHTLEGGMDFRFAKPAR